MRITRKQLRKLIAEHMIKPGIPNVPSDEAIVKIDDLARQDDFQSDADSLAGAFGYPEDQSYSADLRAYDDSGRLGHAIDQMRALGTKYADAESHGEPETYYFKRSALKNAAKICDSFDMSMVKPLIDTFTNAANDYEESAAARIGKTNALGNPYRHEAYDIAGRIALHSDKVASTYGDANYSDLYK